MQVLPAGGSTSVSFTLSERDVSIWDVKDHRFTVSRGDFEVFVGESSCDQSFQRVSFTV